MLYARMAHLCLYGQPALNKDYNKRFQFNGNAGIWKGKEKQGKKVWKDDHLCDLKSVRMHSSIAGSNRVMSARLLVQ